MEINYINQSAENECLKTTCDQQFWELIRRDKTVEELKEREQLINQENRDLKKVNKDLATELQEAYYSLYDLKFEKIRQTSQGNKEQDELINAKKELEEKFQILTDQYEKIRSENESLLQQNKNLNRALTEQRKSNLELIERQKIEQVLDSRKHSTQRFTQIVLNMLECKNCNSYYTHEENDTDSCKYHTAVPIPYARWSKIIGDSTLVDDKYNSYMFWWCCGKLSRTRPVGCVKGQHWPLEKSNEEKALNSRKSGHQLKTAN